MINEKMYGLGDEPSAIRELFAYGMARKAEIGAENVFDFSIGNPSVPAPELVRETMLELLDMDPVALHAYSPAAGLPEVKEAIAAYLSERYDTTATSGHLYLTAGAAAALASSIAAVTHPGDEVVVVSPYFPEYRTWIEAAGCTIVEVPAAVPSFQPDIEALRAAIGPKTSAVIINTPNNPVGAVYTRESLEALAAMLREREEALGRPLYLISDEPYRELVYDGLEPAWIPSLYDATFVCYSWSKSFSLPGERIGYLLVPDTMPDFDHVYKAVCGAGRSLGYICDSVLFQLAVAECVDAPIDIEPYDRNRKILYDGLKEIGYNVIYPQGAFYMWIEALEPDAQAFCETCRQHELLLVPSDGFLTKGWTRVGYCCDEATIRGALDALGIPSAWVTNFLVRKAAHFTEYAVLGILAARAFDLRRGAPSARIALACAVLVLVPSIDEAIQLFVAGRSGQVTDVLLDCCGAATGACLTALVSSLHRP